MLTTAPCSLTKGLGANHVEAQQPPQEVGLHLVGGVHDGQPNTSSSPTEQVLLFTWQWKLAGAEGEAVDAGSGQVVEPLAGDRIGVAEDVKTVDEDSPCVAPFRGFHELHIA